ncbi:GDSL-type esterase/lipase family protein [Micromonospora sp. KC723]|uniref:GDSL-type esterase/lipase family protein n=1 Tax=Micromonospora sp. KC723 TaxID=2530381 RepID=UPI001A9E671C|nr:GDSL-type esterase/lipase family protein [Micromonospora sp. KC723]
MLSRRQRAALLSACAAMAVTGAAVLTAAVASAAVTRYEAETAPATCDGVIESNHTGYSGSGFCNGNSRAGAAAQFTVTASAAGTATIAVRYANGTTANRPADVLLNGAVTHSGVAFNGTGAWTTWATTTLTASLNAGSNTIHLSPTTANGLANIDYLNVEVGASPSPSATVSPPGRPAQCTGSSPITCHFGVSPGNYTVTAWIGDRASAGNTSMSVEARRRILPAVTTAAGTITQYVFTINVRQPEGQPTGQGGTGTSGLSITFAGSAPKLSGLTVQPAGNPLVAYLAGDSTVCDQMIAPYTGWGQILPTRVSAGAVVANYGDSGESSGSFLNNSALFPTMRPLIKSNDLVLIQFGHNDKSTTASAFRGNLTTMINQVRARGGVPVLVTPPVRRRFDGNQLDATARHINGVGVNLPAEMRSLGSSLGVPVIDLTAKSEALVESMGPTNSAQLYLRQSVDGVTDNTHFSEYGAGRMADLVVEGIRERNLSLVSYLR